jgi:glycosyl transferase family 25
MRIFIISLKTALARRAAVAEQLDGLGLSYQFFDAVTGQDAPNHFKAIDPTLYRLNTRREPMANETGCYASHRSLWKLSAELNEPIVILEDDCRFYPNFADAVRTTSKHIDRFGFIRLQSHERARKKPTGPTTYKILEDAGFCLFYLSDVPLCLVAYAVSPTAAASLVRSSATLTAPVDKFMQRTWEHDTPIFALSPASVTTSVHGSSSTIGSRSRKSWDPVLLLRRLVYKVVGEIHRKRFDNRQLRRFLPAGSTAISEPTPGEAD